MSVSFKVENVEISAVRDRAMFNTFAGNRSYVIKGIGDELAVETSSNSFVATLGTGEAVICGGSMLSEGQETTLTLGENESGYIVIEIDLSQTGSNICQFKNVETLVQGDINSGNDYIYDLPLYEYTTNGNGVSSITDVRTLIDSANGGILSINGLQPNENGDINVFDGATNRKINTDLNTIDVPGVYYVGTNDAEAHHFPNDCVNGILLVMSGDTLTNLRQVFFRRGTFNNNDYQIFNRQIYVGERYGNWYSISTNKDLDAICYKPNDTITLSTYVECSGLIGSTASTVYFSIPLGKPIRSDVISVSFSTLSIIIKGANERQAITNVLASPYSCTFNLEKNLGVITVVITGFSGFSAHQPLTVEVQSGAKFKFN